MSRSTRPTERLDSMASSQTGDEHGVLGFSAGQLRQVWGRRAPADVVYLFFTATTTHSATPTPTHTRGGARSPTSTSRDYHGGPASTRPRPGATPSDAPVIPKGDWSSQLPNTFSLLCITHHYDHLMGADHCATRRSLLRPPLPPPPPSPPPIASQNPVGSRATAGVG